MRKLFRQMRHLFKVAVESAQYKWECVKQMPYAVMYQNEAGILRAYVSNLKTEKETLETENEILKAENEILSERYRAQMSTMDSLIELVGKMHKEVNDSCAIVRRDS